MTREKALGWLCVALLLLVGYLVRDDVIVSGNRTVVHNRWTGSISNCSLGECTPFNR